MCFLFGITFCTLTGTLKFCSFAESSFGNLVDFLLLLLVFFSRRKSFNIFELLLYFIGFSSGFLELSRNFHNTFEYISYSIGFSSNFSELTINSPDTLPLHRCNIISGSVAQHTSFLSSPTSTITFVAKYCQVFK